MNGRRILLAPFVIVALASSGCESVSTDPGPTPVCVSAAGVWDVNLVGETGAGITCPERSLVWTVRQNGCDVTIESAAWDTANGATGSIADRRLYVEWSWREGCYRYDESIDVVVDGAAMTGAYYLVRGQAVYPADCPGLGLCRATLTGVRRAP